jgi:hypothetical protein
MGSYIASVAVNFFGSAITRRWTLSLDGGAPETGDYTLAALCSGRYYGGGFFPVPEARMDDGILHAVVVRKVTRPQFLRLIGPYSKGKHASLPAKLIADTGFDALSHAVEAFVATGSSAITDSLARDAFCTVLALLPASYGGDSAHRLRIHEASTMAGLAFTQAGLGLCHAISHALGGMYHIPHGRLNAILLPAVISCNGHAAGEKYAKLSTAAGFVGSSPAIAVRNLKNALIRLRRELDLPATLQQAGVNPLQLRRDMEQLVRAALADPCCATNPQRPEGFMIRRILEEVAGHG